MRLTRLLPLLIIVLMLLVVFQRLIFTDLILARGDTYHYFYPYWDARNDAFSAGELPMWTNDIFMGVPLLANPQIGSFYPLNWLVTGLRAPDAMRVSIVLHVLLAAAGMYALSRLLIAGSRPAALIAALIFAFGGTLGAHIEQINQLQGLAFLPWLLLIFHKLLHSPRRIQWGILLAMVWALQIFTGHTQTVFTSGVGLGIWALGTGLFTETTANVRDRLHQSSIAVLLLGLVAAGTIALALPQLLPTVELTGMSNRGGGFSAQQATAFSLPPIYLPRALLPGYEGLLFGEYVAYSGIVALGLALFGAWIALRGADQQARRGRLWIVLGIIGVLLAFGRFNPLYWLLAELPGFDLFRVPARWMALAAVALALLAGLGATRLQIRVAGWKVFAGIGLLLLALMSAARLLPVQQEDIVGAALPGMLSIALWLAALAGLALLFFLRGRQYTAPFALLLIALELVAASQIMPYNDLAPRDVYLGQRFTISQMLAFHELDPDAGRMLSISQLYFDPGDIETLQARYERLGLDDDAMHTAFTAVKKQEMLFPNLGLTWNIPTIDGFEGGILPTIYYSQLTSLLLLENSLRTVDGRLGEILALPECRGACVPADHWLELTGTQYILTDKVYDVWQDDVAYDTAFPLALDTGESITLRDTLPDFYGTEIRVLFSAPEVSDQPYARLELSVYNPRRERAVTTADLLLADSTDPLRVDDLLLATASAGQIFGGVARYGSIQIDALQPLAIHAVTVVDTRTGDFVQVPLRYPRVLSSDIKIYERSGSERAYLAEQITLLPDTWQGHEDALAVMRNPSFDTGTDAVIHGENLPLTGSSGGIRILTDEATHVEVWVRAEADSWLILRDAWYPGWQATINGEPAAIYRANVMFRAVRVPAGESTVIFSFVPSLWYGAMIAGGMLWIAALLALVWQRINTGRLDH